MLPWCRHWYTKGGPVSTQLRSSRYYSRLLVPVVLRAIFGRREIVRSLGTAAYSDACIKARVWEGRLALLFAFLKEHHQRMTSKEIERLIDYYLTSTLHECEEERATRDVSDDEREAIALTLTDLLEKSQGELIAHDYRRISQTADDLLDTHKYTLEKNSEEYQRLCRGLLQAQQRVFRIESERWEGDYSSFPVTGGNGAGRQSTDPLPLTRSKMISEGLKEYFHHYAHREQRTNQEKDLGFRRFLEIIGGDRPIQEVKKGDCIKFRDTLSRFPRRTPDKLRGKPIADMLRVLEGKRGGYTRVTKNTVNYALDDLRHFFSWAIKHDLFDTKNPVDGIAYEGTKQESYEPFTDGDLVRIFTSPKFLAQQNGRYPGRYWLILSLAYSGARREELAQLLVSDIKQDQEGVWYFDITPDEERGTRVKNEASQRRTPLHSHLVHLGFLAYVEKVKKLHGEKSLLFPIPKKTRGRQTVGDAVGKWHQRHCRKVGVTGKKPLHSFRHTVVTRLIGAGVAQDKVQMIVGHTDSTVTGGIYTDRQMIPLTLLQQCLEKLEYQSLSLTKKHA
jgi:integrase